MSLENSSSSGLPDSTSPSGFHASSPPPMGALNGLPQRRRSSESLKSRADSPPALRINTSNLASAHVPNADSASSASSSLSPSIFYSALESREPEDVPLPPSRSPSIESLRVSSPERAETTSETVAGKALRIASVTVAQLGQQTVTCFVPTVVREMAAIGVSTTMEAHPKAALGLQTAIGGARIAADYYRRHRLERHIDDATANGHGLTADQWDAQTPEQQAAMRANTRWHSNVVTAANLASVAGNLGIGIAGIHAGSSPMTSTALGNEVRNLAYMATRDTLSGSGSATTVRPGPGMAPAGTNPVDMRKSAFAYGALQGASSVVSQVAVSAFEKANDLHLDGEVLTDGAGRLLPLGKAARSATQIGMIRAAANALAETAESIEQSVFQSNEAKGRIEVKLATNKDQVRVLDHGATRLAWNGVGSVAGTLTGLISAPTALAKTGINAVGQVAAFGATYISVNHTYQAHAGDRKAQRVADSEIANPDVEAQR
jgi:hypothetical protein